MFDDVYYIKYLNSKKNLQREIIEFKGNNALEEAKLWGKKNLSNFNEEYIYKKIKSK